jgi:hypothetical protein
MQAPILLESRALAADKAWVSGFGRRRGLDFGRFFALKKVIGEGERERRALSGEAFRGSGGFAAWFRASATSKGEGFREFPERFRQERAAEDRQLAKGEGMREPGFPSSGGPEMSCIGQR